MRKDEILATGNNLSGFLDEFALVGFTGGS
jgi:hypothetical protein